jgi:hypothetical protein
MSRLNGNVVVYKQCIEPSNEWYVFVILFIWLNELWEENQPVWIAYIPKNLTNLEESLQDMEKNII